MNNQTDPQRIAARLREDDTPQKRYAREIYARLTDRIGRMSHARAVQLCPAERQVIYYDDPLAEVFHSAGLDCPEHLYMRLLTVYYYGPTYEDPAEITRIFDEDGRDFLIGDEAYDALNQQVTAAVVRERTDPY